MKTTTKKLASALALAVYASTAAMGFAACSDKSQQPRPQTPAGVSDVTSRLPAPSDGSLPTQYTAAQNLAFVAYVLDSRPAYRCYTDVVTQTPSATLTTKSYKDYFNGVALSSEITYSPLVKSGTQTCFYTGENGAQALVRSSVAPTAETTHLTAEWSGEAPVRYSEGEYKKTYGLFHTEMTGYVINEGTITSAEPLVENDDGTYTQSVVLDPQYGTVYHKYAMQKRGGFDDLPEFKSVELSVTFDQSWQVLTVVADDLATAVNGSLAVEAKSHSVANYSYGAENLDIEHCAFFESYFKEYATDLKDDPASQLPPAPVTRYGTTRAVAPSDGSLPTDYTSARNLAYIAYVLDNQKSYHCYTDTSSTALFITQTTKSTKDYLGGVMVSTDITHSSFVQGGTQTCFYTDGSGSRRALLRESEKPSADTTHETAVWKAGDPAAYSETEFLGKYGAFQTEMTNYVINEGTIVEDKGVVANGDGTYTLSVVLDPSTSTEYYKYGMQTRGGLDELPVFSSVALSVTFDGSWRPLTVVMDDVAKVKMILPVESKSHSVATYSYDGADFDANHYSAYESYFKQYID